MKIKALLKIINAKMWNEMFLQQQKTFRVIVIVLLPLLILLNSGCKYYKANKLAVTTRTPAEKLVEALNLLTRSGKYVVVHQGENKWHFTNIAIDYEKKIISGVFTNVDSAYIPFMDKIKDHNYRKYSTKDSKYIFTQMHIYIDNYSIDHDINTISISSIKKIEEYQIAHGPTRTIYVLTGFVAVIAFICNCPYVYTYDGANYNFTGTMFPGAIYPPLERNDYLKLPGFVPVDGQYQLQIANKKKEHQFTNMIELMVVHHLENTEVIADKNGIIHSVSTPEIPVVASAFEKYSHLNEVSFKDDKYMLFDEDEKNQDLNNLSLSFKKQAGAKQAKLIINAKNSMWSGYVFDEFSALFGTSFSKYSEKQKDVPAEKNIKWSLEQGVDLSVYLKTENGWEFVDYFDVAGSLSDRDMIMPIDISKIKSDTISVMLNSGFMLWEINYAAMDFSEDLKLQTEILKPLSVTDSLGNDFTKELTENDSLYLKHYNVNDNVKVKFKAITNLPGMKQTVILHSKGYYKRLGGYTGKPQVKYLKTFSKPGAFSVYSKEKRIEYLHTSLANNH